MRRSWGGDRVALGASLFHVDWQDIQVAGGTPFSAQGITLNGGAAVSRGVEVAASAGLTGALRLRGSWCYTRAALSQDSPGLLDDGADAFEGDRLAGAPRSQGSLFASYGTLLGDEVAIELLYLRLQLHQRRADPLPTPPTPRRRHPQKLWKCCGQVVPARAWRPTKPVLLSVLHHRCTIGSATSRPRPPTGSCGEG